MNIPILTFCELVFRWAPPQEDHRTKKLWHLTAAFRGPNWHAVIMAMRYGPGADREIIVEMDDMTA